MRAKNVFIATLPRSGSTLIGMMLGAHSKICHIGESAYWSKVDVHTTKCCCGIVGCQKLLDIHNIISPFPEEIGAVHTACGMIDFLEEPDKVRHSLSHSAPTFRQETLVQTLHLCCAGLERISNAARTVFNKEIVVENSKYLPIAKSLLHCDKDWKIIVMARDPRGIAFCSKEAGKRKGVPRPVSDKIELFLSFANRAVAMVKQDNVLLVRYEDLCRNTLGTLERVCDFLEVSFEEQMLQFKRHKGHLLMANHMMHDSNERVREDLRWHDLLDHEEKLLFVRRDLLCAYERIGYNLEKF